MVWLSLHGTLALTPAVAAVPAIWLMAMLASSNFYDLLSIPALIAAIEEAA